MRLENDELIYRSRFEVYQDGASESAFSMIVSVLWQWLRKKEYRRYKDHRPTMYWGLEEDDQFDKFKSSGFAFPSRYQGGSGLDLKATALCVEMFTDSDGRIYWAMEYDEPDGNPKFVWRHWHTRVGLTAEKDGSSCLVNVYISYYNVQTYYGKDAPEPKASVPNFVKSILRKKGYRARVGETEILLEARYLTPDTFISEFRSSLLDPNRQIPLILMATDWDGRTPVDDADDIANSVLGMANVYVIDWRNQEQRDVARELFKYGRSAYNYRCINDMLRIYQPRINLNNEVDYKRHQYFYKSRIQDICKDDPDEDGKRNNSFKDVLNRHLSLSVGRDDRDVVDLNDLRRKENQELLKQNQERVNELLEDIERRKAERLAAVAQPVVVTQDKNAQKQIDDLKAEIAEWEEFAEAYEVEITTLKGDVQKLQGTNKALEEEKDDLNAALDSKRYLLSAALEREESADTKNQQLEASTNKLKDLSVNLADSLKDLLEILDARYSSKIVILDEAWNSAEDFRGFDCDEYWKILESMPTDLWNIYFGDEDYSGRVDDEYQRRTGFELSLTETKATQANQRLMRLRKRKYKNREIDITPHIKGRDKNPKFTFRVHYYVDRDDQKIVIGHCGEHLETSGTQKIS